MKTVRLEGAALDMAKELSFLLNEGEKRVNQMRSDIDVVEATIQKEAGAKLKEILELVGIDSKKFQGSVDATYLADHGLAFVQYEEKRSLSSILESVVAGAVAQPQDSVQ